MKTPKLHLLVLLLMVAFTIKAQNLPVQEANGLGGLQQLIGTPAADIKIAFAKLQFKSDSDGNLFYNNDNFKISFFLTDEKVNIISYTAISKDEKAKFKADLAQQGYLALSNSKMTDYAKPLGEGNFYHIKAYPKDSYMFTKLNDESLTAKVPYTATKENGTVATPIANGRQTYLFQSQCKSGSKRFNVISKVDADLAKNTFDEVKQAALKIISNNAWQIQTELKYLGTADMVILKGEPGKDYSVSTNSLN